MKLSTRFLQLPIQFDAARLAQEIAAFDASAWRPHPAGYEGNDFLPLISAHGDPANESFRGPMRPTPHLSAAPYLQEVLGALGAVLGRTRLMRLSGNAEVTEHVDVNYYWRGRMRVHVPIVTQPVVNFICGDQNVHMAAGECWVFDTWSLHRVTNHQTDSRTHLVVDTVGGDGLLRLLQAGRAPGVDAPGWTARPAPAVRGPLEFESVNMPVVMSPWEMREHIQFLLSEAAPGQAMAGEVARASSVFLHRWGALWSQFGEADAGFDRYRAALAHYVGDLKAVRANDLLLVNEVDFFEAFNGIVVGAALAPRRAPQSSDAA